MKSGYIRVSTVEQNEQRQIKVMEEKNIEKLFIAKNMICKFFHDIIRTRQHFCEIHNCMIFVYRCFK